MNRTQFLLTKLAEECNEVAQRALKAQQFGMDEVQEGQSENNEQRLTRELHDLFAAIETLVEEGYLPDPMEHPERFERIDAKKAKVEKYYRYALDHGMNGWYGGLVQNITVVGNPPEQLVAQIKKGVSRLTQY